MKTHDADKTYVHLDNTGAARLLNVDDKFWADLTAGRRPDLEHGHMVMAFSFAAPWDTWEMHPQGEEVVLLLSGEATFVLETDRGLERVRLSRTGEFVVVPRGTWHTADAAEPTTMLFITAGAGTQHRPR